MSYQKPSSLLPSEPCGIASGNPRCMSAEEGRWQCIVCYNLRRSSHSSNWYEWAIVGRSDSNLDCLHHGHLQVETGTRSFVPEPPTTPAKVENGLHPGKSTGGIPFVLPTLDTHVECRVLPASQVTTKLRVKVSVNNELSDRVEKTRSYGSASLDMFLLIARILDAGCLKTLRVCLDERIDQTPITTGVVRRCSAKGLGFTGPHDRNGLRAPISFPERRRSSSLMVRPASDIRSDSRREADESSENRIEETK